MMIEDEKSEDRKMKKFFLGLLLGNLAVFSIVFPKSKTRAEKKQYDCAIVCGYFANEDGTPSELMKTRVEKAVKLWKKGKVYYLILSGGAVRNEHIEAEVMKKYAMKLGVPAYCILEEKQAGSTYHNMLFAKEIMQTKHLKDCVVVTNGWHLRKANHYARKFELDYVMAKADDPQDEKAWQTLWRYISVNVHMYYMMFKGYY